MFEIKKLSFFLLLVTASLSMEAQSFWFGPKVGGGLSFQQWSNFEPNPIFAPSIDLCIESYDELKTGSIYASLGYHTRGSRIRSFTFNGDFFGNQGFRFNNASLELGIKKEFTSKDKISLFYLFGIRGEYTISNNLKEYERFANAFYPLPPFANKIVYGATFGGGITYPLGEFYQGVLELTIAPDLRDQYFQPPLNNVRDPFSGMNVTIPERRIKNLSVELKASFMFLRKVVYY
jgi:hypothetical protein